MSHPTPPRIATPKITINEIHHFEELLVGGIGGPGGVGSGGVY